MADTDRKFSAEELTIARMAMRRAAGAGPECLDQSTFIDAMCVEIDLLRHEGLVDEEIAVIIVRAICYSIPAEAVAQCKSPNATEAGFPLSSMTSDPNLLHS